MPGSYDAIVIGAGPAGCGAARLLAAWGHRTLLIDRPEADSRTLAESIPPSAQKILAALGMLTSIEDARFLPWRGNTVWWGEAEPRAESFAPGAAGYLVARRSFDRRLRELAVESGADLRAGLVREVRIAGLERGGHDPAPAVVVDAGGVRTRATAPFILDCSGRAGVVARQGLREIESSPRTVALVGVWRAPAGWPTADDTHTLVASYADGWAWSVPTEPGVRYFTVMVDPARTELARAAPATDRYTAELTKVSGFRPLLDEATLVGSPWGADASLYGARQYAGPGFLLVGDAGSFIDPLSSFGVKKALASGWLAAITTHTALVRPAMRDEAQAFFDRRERAVFASARKQAARFAADAAADTPHPFWLARAVGSGSDLDLDDEIDAAALARDPQVIAAFDDLRRRHTVSLRAGDQARVAPRAAVRGREIVLDDHLILPAWPNGVRYLRGVDLVTLVRVAPDHADVGAMFEAFVRTQPGVALPDFLGALSVLTAWGALRHA